MSPAPKTEEEKAQLISQMREKVEAYINDEYWKSDAYLWKWIEDRNYNVDKAEKALRKSLKWRLDSNIDGILEENFDDLHKNLVYYIDGVDKEGRPVVTIPCNRCNIKGALEAGNKEKFLRFGRQMVERAAEQIRQSWLKDPKAPTTFVGIYDFTGVDVSKVTPQVINLIISATTGTEDHYPGLLECVYIINASKAIKNIYGFVKPALRKKTVESVRIFSDKRHKWEPAILEVIDPEQIRPRFGGTKTVEGEDELEEQIHDLTFDVDKLMKEEKKREKEEKDKKKAEEKEEKDKKKAEEKEEKERKKQEEKESKKIKTSG